MMQNNTQNPFVFFEDDNEDIVCDCPCVRNYVRPKGPITIRLECSHGNLLAFSGFNVVSCANDDTLGPINPEIQSLIPIIEENFDDVEDIDGTAILPEPRPRVVGIQRDQVVNDEKSIIFSDKMIPPEENLSQVIVEAFGGVAHVVKEIEAINNQLDQNSRPICDTESSNFLKSKTNIHGDVILPQVSANPAEYYNDQISHEPIQDGTNLWAAPFMWKWKYKDLRENVDIDPKKYGMKIPLKTQSQKEKARQVKFTQQLKRDENLPDGDGVKSGISVYDFEPTLEDGPKVFTGRFEIPKVILDKFGISTELGGNYDFVKSFMDGLLRSFEAIDRNFLGSAAPYLHLTESIVSFLYVARLCTTQLELHACAYNFISAVCPGISFTGKNYFSYLLQSFVHGYFEGKRKAKIQEEEKKKPEINIEATAVSDELQKVSNFLTHIIESPVAKALQNFLLSVICFGWFKKDIASQIMPYLEKPEKKLSVLQLVKLLLESIAKLAKAGEAMMAGKAFSDIFFSENTLEAAKMRQMELHQTVDQTYGSYPIAGRVSRDDWFRDAYATEKFFAETLKNMSRLHKDYEQTFKKSLELKQDLLKLQAIAKNRPTPMLIILHGMPMVGKSNVEELIYHAYSYACNNTFHSSQVYVKDGRPFWDGYETGLYRYVKLSEFGSDNKDVATNGESLIDLLTSLIDSRPYKVQKADIKESAAYFTSQLVLCDTNCVDMGYAFRKRNVSAFERRGLYIEPIVKPKYRKDNSPAIDSNKCNDGTRWLDRYFFRVHINEPKDLMKSNTIELMKGDPDDNIDKLWDLLVNFFRHHNAEQDRMINKRSDPNTFRCYGTQHNPMQHGFGNIDSDIFGSQMAPPRPIVVATAREDIIPNLRNRFASVKTKITDFFIVKRDSVVETTRDIWKDCMTVKSDVSHMASLFIVSSIAKTVYEATPEPAWCKFNSLRVILFSIFFMVINCLWVRNLFSYLIPLMMFVNLSGCFSSAFKEKLGEFIETTDGEVMTKANHLQEYFGYNVLKEHVNKIDWYKGCMTLAAAVGIMIAAKTAFSAVSEYYHSDKDDQIEEEETEKVMNPVSTAASTFVREDVITDDLIAFEDSIQAGNSIVRHATLKAKEWNSQRQVLPVSYDQSDPKALLKRVNSCVRRLRFWWKINGVEKSYTQFGLGCESTVILTNRHPFPADLSIGITVSVYETASLDNSNISRDVLLCERNVQEIGNDLCLIYTPGSLFKNIVTHFAPNELDTRGLAYIFEPLGEHVFATYHKEKLEYNGAYGPITIDSYIMFQHKALQVGVCGWPMIYPQSNGFVIAGIQSAADVNLKVGFISITPRDVIQKGIFELFKKLELIKPFSCGREDFLPQLEEPAQKSIVRHEELQSCIYIGKYPGPILANERSRLKLWYFEAEAVPEIIKITQVPKKEHYGIPMMNSFKRNGEWHSPINNGMRKMNQKRGVLNADLSAKVVRVMENKILSNLNDRGIMLIQPYGFQTAINGVPYDAFLRRINASKASGFGLSGIKAKHIPIVSEINGMPNREMTEEVCLEVKRILEAYNNEEIAIAIFEGRLKDEPRTIDRCKSGNTRLFWVSPLGYLIITRMLLGPLFTLMVEHMDAFYCLIGIDMHRGWSKKFKTLKEFSQYWMEFDYSKYDLVMPWEIKHITATVIYNLCKRLGYNEHALKIVRGLLSDALFPYLKVLMDIFCVPGVQPSGAGYTAERNSFDGLALPIYYLMYLISEGVIPECDFFEVCLPVVYGDDALIAVKSEIKDHFNNLTYQKFCKDVYKMDITPASSKTGEMQEFVTPEEASFLKRKTAYCEHIGDLVAQLSMDSIYKMLEWHIPSKDVPLLDQAIGTMNSALMELFFHVSEQQFNEIRTILIDASCKHFQMAKEDLSPCILTFYKRKNDLLLQPIATSRNDEKKELEEIISDQEVGTETYMRDHMCYYADVVKRTEHVMKSIKEPFPGLTYVEIQVMRQYSNDETFRTYVDEWFRLKNIRDSAAISKERFQRALTKKMHINATARKDSTQEKERAIKNYVSDSLVVLYTIKTEVSKISGKAIKGGVKEDILKFASIETAYLTAIEMRLGNDTRSIDWNLPEDISTLTGLVEWTVNVFTHYHDEWSKYVLQFSESPFITVYAADITKISGLYEKLRGIMRLLPAMLKFSPPDYDEKDVVATSRPDGDTSTEMNQISQENLTIGEIEAPVIVDEMDESKYTNMVRSPQDPTAFMKHPVKLASYTLSLNTDFDVTLSPWDLLTRNPAIRAKFRNFNAANIKSIGVLIEMTSMQFHYFLLGACYVPWANKLSVPNYYKTAPATFRYSKLQWMVTQRQFQMIRGGSNVQIQFILKKINIQNSTKLWNLSAAAIPAASGFDDMANLGVLYISTYDQPKALNLAPIATDPKMYVYGWIEEIELDVNTSTQLEITTTAREDERKTGPVERFASNAAQVSNALTSVPAIAPLAMASHMVFRGIEKFSSIFGWSCPNVDGSANPVFNKPLQNGANVLRRDVIDKISFDPLQETSVDMSNMGSNDDEMVFATEKGQWGLMYTGTWAPTQASDTFMCTWAVNPMVVTCVSGATYRVIQPTPLGQAAQPFTYWNGPIEYYIQFSTAKGVHRGKVTMIYEPNITQYALQTSSYESYAQQGHVIDIGSNTDAAFCVNYCATRDWLCLGTHRDATLSVGTIASPTSLFDNANGWCGLIVETPLQSPDSSSVQYNIYVRGPGVRFAGPATTLLPTSRIMATAREDITTPFISEPVTCVELNPVIVNLEKTLMFHFGEATDVSKRALMKRYTTKHVQTGVLTANTGCLTFTLPIHPTVYPLFNSTVLGSFQPSIEAWMKYSYAFCRGGRKYRALLYGAEFSGPMSSATISLSAPSNSTTVPTAGFVSGATPISRFEGSIPHIVGTQGAVEFEIPDYSVSLALFSGSDDPYGVDTNMTNTQYRNFKIEFGIANTSAFTSCVLTLDECSSEDRTYAYWIGTAPFQIPL